MAINPTSGTAISTLFQAQTRQKESIKSASEGIPQQPEFENVDEQTPAALQQKLTDMADDMASVAAQFRNRRELEQKGNLLSESFERVLDDDVVPKAKKLIEVLSVKNSDIDILMERARALFLDDSDLYLVLKELLKRKELSQVQRTRLEALLAKMEEKADLKMLKAGINCALKARLFGAKLALKASFLRQTYRRFLEGNNRPVGD
ncbi:type III secretion system gatekeeper subunit SctW [Glaciimonas sp. Gout2]|nr:type III secretion system gatekeeper subunit SctW [Glaciimonas sp. Gout2]MEB0084898.1 type III secretion system gatekeeper subunit SctW [Glaciimonas sp. Gout2]